MKTLTIALLAAIGLSGCVAYPVYERPRAYYNPEPTYSYSYSYRPYRDYYGSRYDYYGSRYTY